MPGMPTNLWGASPLYENGSLKESSIPTVTPIEQLLDEGNCGRVYNTGITKLIMIGTNLESPRRGQDWPGAEPLSEASVTGLCNTSGRLPQ